MINSLKKVMYYLMAAVICVAPGFLSADNLSYSQEEVRIAFLYRSLQYVKWDSFLTDTDTSLVICSNAAPPITGLLKSLNNRSVANRSLKVVIKNNYSASDNCNIVYYRTASSSKYRDIVQLYNGKSVLTINDNPAFINAGGILNFILKNNRMTIEVNLDQAEKNGIYFSAKFLRIATLIGNKE